LFVALLVAPRAALVERGTQVVRRALPPLRLDRRTQIAVTVVGAGVLLVIPHVVGTRIPLYSSALAFVILFASLSLLVRTSGQISLCHMTFAAIGASVYAHAMANGVPWPVTMLLAGLVATPAGAVVAIPAIRLSGVYLAIATFGFALLVQDLVFPASWMFGNFSHVMRAPRPRIAWLHTHGANTNLTRLWVFCISAFFAGVGGAALAPVTGAVNAYPFDFTISLTLVAVLFIAGRQPIAGAFLAAALYQVGPGYLTSSTALGWIPVLFGAGALITAMAGGLPILDRSRTSKRSRARLGRSPVRARGAALRGTV